MFSSLALSQLKTVVFNQMRLPPILHEGGMSWPAEMRLYNEPMLICIIVESSLIEIVSLVITGSIL